MDVCALSCRGATFPLRVQPHRDTWLAVVNNTRSALGERNQQRWCVREKKHDIQAYTYKQTDRQTDGQTGINDRLQAQIYTKNEEEGEASGKRETNLHHKTHRHSSPLSLYQPSLSHEKYVIPSARVNPPVPLGARTYISLVTYNTPWGKEGSGRERRKKASCLEVILGFNLEASKNKPGPQTPPRYLLHPRPLPVDLDRCAFLHDQSKSGSEYSAVRH